MVLIVSKCGIESINGRYYQESNEPILYFQESRKYCIMFHESKINKQSQWLLIEIKNNGCYCDIKDTLYMAAPQKYSNLPPINNWFPVNNNPNKQIPIVTSEIIAAQIEYEWEKKYQTINFGKKNILGKRKLTNIEYYKNQKTQKLKKNSNINNLKKDKIDEIKNDLIFIPNSKRFCLKNLRIKNNKFIKLEMDSINIGNMKNNHNKSMFVVQNNKIGNNVVGDIGDNNDFDGFDIKNIKCNSFTMECDEDDDLQNTFNL